MPNTCPTSTSGPGSSGSHTHPVPSIAAWVAGSASTANTASAGASIRRIACTASAVVPVPMGALSVVGPRTIPMTCYVGHSSRRDPGGAAGVHVDQPVAGGRDDQAVADLEPALRARRALEHRVLPRAAVHPDDAHLAV